MLDHDIPSGLVDDMLKIHMYTVYLLGRIQYSCKKYLMFPFNNRNKMVGSYV